MKKIEKKIDKILLLMSIIIILVGICFLLYPTVSDYLAKKNQVEIIREYDEVVSNLDEEEINKEWQKAQTYNENLSGEPVHDPFVEGSGYALPENYKEVLNISENGIMAHIEIPKISIYLPIYHGTNSQVLEKGVGHIESTSFPIGGASSHCVLTGHTGLPSAELFTKLDELEVGDIFYIHILNKVLTYKIYETKVILPDKIDELQITSGKDLVTLVTCTPYGINSHRLLVKAERTEYEEYNQNESVDSENNIQIKNIDKNYYLIGIIIGFIIILVIIVFFAKKKQKCKH